MDFNVLLPDPPPPAWQWALTVSAADSDACTEDWMMFPAVFQSVLEAARESGESNVQLGAAGSLDMLSMSFTPAVAKGGELSQPMSVRRCESKWKVSGFHHDASAPGGYCLRRPSYYEPSVSQFLEDRYQLFLQDPSCHTITDPSGQYVYCFDRRPADVNPALIAMLQWPQGRPRRARVVTREGDARTNPVIPPEADAEDGVSEVGLVGAELVHEPQETQDVLGGYLGRRETTTDPIAPVEIEDDHVAATGECEVSASQDTVGGYHGG